MRIEPLSDHEIPASLRGYFESSDRGACIVRGLGRKPETLKTWLDLYYGATRGDGALPLELKEMVRHLLAQLSSCEVCQAVVSDEGVARGLTVEKIARVTDPDESFTEPERELLSFCGKLFAGHEQVNAEDFRRMEEHYSLEQITEAGFMVSFFAAAARLNFGFGVFE